MRRVLMLLLLIAGAPGGLFGAEVERVEVVNLPEVQTIVGTVEVEGAVAPARFVALSETIVPPVRPRDTTALVEAGELDVSGFAEVVLSLAGQVRADFFAAGTVGAILIPDEPLALEAFVEVGQLLSPLRVEAKAHPSEIGTYFASEPETRLIAFPRYRVFLYNTTDRPAVVTLYGYLRN